MPRPDQHTRFALRWDEQVVSSSRREEVPTFRAALLPGFKVFEYRFQNEVKVV